MPAGDAFPGPKNSMKFCSIGERGETLDTVGGKKVTALYNLEARQLKSCTKREAKY
jgi:hypothetical protein